MIWSDMKSLRLSARVAWGASGAWGACGDVGITDPLSTLGVATYKVGETYAGRA